MIAWTAQQIRDRAYTVWPLGSVKYSMVTANSPTGHRDDCSGFASAVLGLPTPGLSTVTLVTTGVLVPIFKHELQVGDFIGDLDLGSGGANGHVQVVTAVHATTVEIVEQAGGTWGPSEGIERRTDILEAYRYAALTSEENDMPYDRNTGWLLQNGVLGLQHPATIPQDDTAGSPPQGPGVDNMLALKLDEILAAVRDLQAVVGVAEHTHIPGGVTRREPA